MHHQVRVRVGVCLGLLLLVVAVPGAAQPAEPPGWARPLLDQLCGTYAIRPEASDADAARCLEEATVEIGRRLSVSGPTGVPAADLAALALLLSQPVPESGVLPSSRRDDALVGAPGPTGAPGGAATETLTDIGKGQEGLAQGVERLTALPLSERMVVTGDITSGFQAATVPDAPELTSAFGRARVNFVTRATPGSRDGRVSEGYFMVQMIAAGGAVDASPVGGPSAFSPINDVATDRSDFNQGASRGNLYLKKAFYQQEIDLGTLGRVLGRVGVISLSDLFDTSEFANNESRQFLNAAFVNSPAYKAGVGAPGFMLEYRREVGVRGIEELAVRSGYGITRTFRALTSPLWTNEVEARVTAAGRPGAYRVGATVGNVPDAGGLHGLHVGLDQWISDTVGLFGRYARSNSGPGSRALGPVRQSYSLGVQRRFGQDERVSAWGLAFSQALPIVTLDLTSSERVLETYYRHQFTPELSLTPDLQLVLGSGGREQGGTHLVGSLRVTAGF